MRLLDLLMNMDGDTMVSVQKNETDDESMFNIKKAQEFELGEVRGWKVVSFYPERYNAGYCLGITVIVKEENHA